MLQQIIFVILNAGKDGNDCEIQKVFCSEEEENAEGPGQGKKKKRAATSLKKARSGIGYTEEPLSNRCADPGRSNKRRRSM